jgi:hypothetical protein
MFSTLKHDKYGVLCGSIHRSVIPYVHRENYCMCCLSLELNLSKRILKRAESRCLNRWLHSPFIAHGQAVTYRPRARQVVPRWLMPYYNNYCFIARSR